MHTALNDYLTQNGGDGTLTVTDTGGELCTQASKQYNTLDIFVGEGDQGLGSRALGTGYWGLAAATDDFSDAEDVYFK
ncbi:MAG: hypothetical protein WCA79_12060 [Anaerolineales bacterium]